MAGVFWEQTMRKYWSRREFDIDPVRRVYVPVRVRWVREGGVWRQLRSSA